MMPCHKEALPTYVTRATHNARFSEARLIDPTSPAAHDQIVLTIADGNEV